jgi:F420-0:gamma-glutamyl ligase
MSKKTSKMTPTEASFDDLPEALKASLRQEAKNDVVCLAEGITRVRILPETEEMAIDVSQRLFMSPHEWTWTQSEQESMAHYCIWAAQRLAGIKQLVSGRLDHGVPR